MAVGLLSGSLAACYPREEWAAAAEDYVADLHTAYDTGFTNVAQFYAEDAVVDQRGFTGYRGVGRPGLAHNMRRGYEFPWETDPTDRFRVTAEEPVYLSLDGAIDPMWWQVMGLPHLSVAPVFAITGEGIIAETWTGAAHTAGYAGNDHTPMDPIALGYVQAWASGDPAGIEALYAPAAGLRDSLRNLILEDRAAIAAAAGSTFAHGALPGARLRQIPEANGHGGNGYYFNLINDSSENAGFGSTSPADMVQAVHRMVLLLDVTDDRGCLRQVGTLLWLESGSITREERFHRVDSMRRCAEPGRLPDGWWDAVQAPEPDTFTRTGTIDALGRPITLWNATPAREGLLRWALQRFSEVGLSPPLPASVTFVAFDGDPWSRFGFVPATADVILPDTADGCPAEGCTSWPTAARALALTELATSWIVESSHQWPLPELARREGLAWDAEDVDTSRELINLAGQTLTWGLMDEPYDLDPALGSRTCAQISSEFEALTLAVPAGLACSPTPSATAVTPP